MLAGLLAQDHVDPSGVSGAAIASVVPPLTEAFQHLCQRLFHVRPLTVDAGVRTGIRVATHNPREVGPDRVVNAVAAHHLYGGAAIIVDFGTPTSFDVVAADGAYLGSVIAPGLAVSAEALFQATSRLPRVDLVRPKTVVGKDTASALQSGILLGHVALVEGLLTRIQAEVGEGGQVIATGELAALIARETDAIDRVEPYLTLIGLRHVYELNMGSAVP
jgi:type III pantothenate kinase